LGSMACGCPRLIN